jgi:succinate-semialdehyde dehydrogenase/glutarate-semialdehyde dehydrogenase
MLQDTPINVGSGLKCFLSHERLGILFQIAPFNFPFHQVIRFLSVSLMIGNVAIFHHSHNTPMSAVALENIFSKSGFPPNTVQLAFITREQSDKLIKDPRVCGVSVTGSVAAGAAVAKKAGEEVRKQVMELGGSDAYIVCNDCDLNYTIKECVRGRTTNNGQSCVAAKRFIVHKDVYDEFVKGFVDTMKQLKMGDPMEEGTDIGPLARKDLRDTCHDQVKRAVSNGAKLLLGGQVPQTKGFFYPPTVLEVSPNNPVFKEEIFAPVAMITKANSEEEALHLANSSPFGLGGGVFTRDTDKGVKLVRKLESGLGFVNKVVDQMPQYPFGGIKYSGYGKESGEAGLKEWVRLKTVLIQ